MVRTESVDGRLGRLLSTHPVAGERYWRTGGAALAFVLGGLLLAGLLIAFPALAGARPLAFALIPTLAGVPVAIVQLRRAARSGRDEAYELYENGIAHRASGNRRSWTWDQVAVLHATPDAPREAPSPIPLERLGQRLGWDYGCAVRFTDGARLRIDGYTTDAVVIARTLLDRCPTAVAPPDTRLTTAVLLTVLPVATVGFGTGTVLLYRYLNDTAASDISGSMGVVLALGMLTCVVGTVLSLVGFVMVLLSTRP